MRGSSGIAVAGLAITLASCDNMANQAKLKPYELPYGSELLWPVKPPLHTVARDAPLKPPSAPPLTMALLERGKQRFEIYCAPCHSRTGDGNGIIVQRRFPRPPSYYSEELERASNEHFYHVITHGHGVMFSYADRVDPSDRWAIIAYIRALQASANATAADVPADKREAL